MREKRREKNTPGEFLQHMFIFGGQPQLSHNFKTIVSVKMSCVGGETVK